MKLHSFIITREIVDQMTDEEREKFMREICTCGNVIVSYEPPTGIKISTQYTISYEQRTKNHQLLLAADAFTDGYLRALGFNICGNRN